MINNKVLCDQALAKWSEEIYQGYHIWNILGKLPVMESSIKGWGLVFWTCINDLMVIGGQRRLEGENIDLNFLHPAPEGRYLKWNLLIAKQYERVLLLTYETILLASIPCWMVIKNTFDIFPLAYLAYQYICVVMLNSLPPLSNDLNKENSFVVVMALKICGILRNVILWTGDRVYYKISSNQE